MQIWWLRLRLLPLCLLLPVFCVGDQLEWWDLPAWFASNPKTLAAIGWNIVLFGVEMAVVMAWGVGMILMMWAISDPADLMRAGTTSGRTENGVQPMRRSDRTPDS